MKQYTFWLLILLMIGFGGTTVNACNLSSFTLNNYYYDNGRYHIQTTLRIGRGVTGVTTGADGDTRSISFAFYDNQNAGINILSMSPMNLVGPYSGCGMPGFIFNSPQGPPYNCDDMAMFIDPGYYGQQPCMSYPFECISSTAQCGPAGFDTFPITFEVDKFPDSIRCFGVEGNGNPLGGCYPNLDMLILGCPSCPFYRVLDCPGPSIVQANSNCEGIVPNYRNTVDFALFCEPLVYLAQSPLAGANIGPVGTTINVSLFGSNQSPLSATCVFSLTVVNGTPPQIINCPGNQGIPANLACEFVLPNYQGLIGYAPACNQTPTVTQQPAPGTLITGSTSVTLIATDLSGNRDTCRFVVGGYDITPPILTCPSNQLFALNTNCQFVMTNLLNQGSAVDNCGGIASFT